MRLLVPPAPFADDRNGPRVGSEDGEVAALRATDRSRMRSELLVDAEVSALVEEVKVLVGQQGDGLCRPRDPPGTPARSCPRHFLRNLRPPPVKCTGADPPRQTAAARRDAGSEPGNPSPGRKGPGAARGNRP